jgi:UDP-N-acetylmuramate dehydrogenase
MSPSLEPRRSVPLARYTSLQLGGTAEHFVEVNTASELAEALAWAERHGAPVTVLGGGSNVVIADAGLPGLVLRVARSEETSVLEGERALVTIGAGASWDELVERTVARGWAGLECLSGIPGCAGATPIQNVGAYGQEVADTLAAVRAYDRQDRMLRELSAAECQLSYRSSRFKTHDAGRFIVLDVCFALHAGGAPHLGYPEIARRFTGTRPTLAGVRSAVLATRRDKSMLLDPSDENGRSCGSFFLNPALDAAQLEQLRARAPNPPTYPQPDGRFKVPAAWLIERAGFQKGQRWGAVGISSRHSLALVAHAGATSRQLLEAAHRVREGVAGALGVLLEPEPIFLGFGSAAHGLPSL